MKHTVFRITLTALACLLIGCSAEPPAAPAAFSANVSVDGAEPPCGGTVEVTEDIVRFTVSEPSTAAGLCYTFTGGELRTSFGDHSAVAPHDYLPAGSVPEALYQCLSYLDTAEYLKTEEGNDTYALSTPYGQATLTVRDGVPTALTAEFAPYTFRFS